MRYFIQQNDVLMCFNNDLFCIYQEEMEANYKIIVINKAGVLSLVTSSWRPVGTVLITGKRNNNISDIINVKDIL